MSQELLGFIAFVIGLAVYLVWSAKTEMGTKGWRKK